MLAADAARGAAGRTIEKSINVSSTARRQPRRRGPVLPQPVFDERFIDRAPCLGRRRKPMGER
jgi:hypothetical protein